MEKPIWLEVERWLVERHPDELSHLAVEFHLVEGDIEYGFLRAIEGGHLEWIGEFVISLGCGLDRFSDLSALNCPLSYALLNSEAPTVEKLLSLGADPNVLVNREFYRRPLHVAIDLEATGSSSDLEHDQGLSDFATELGRIGFRWEAIKATGAIESWKLRWETGAAVLAGRKIVKV